jgi:peroxiredoxin
LAVIALGVIFFLNNQGGSTAGTGQAGQYAFQVGSPGPGAQAPTIQLPSTAGGTFDLASQRGKTVLLYFQEGLTCQPCWDQLKDIQSNIGQFKALGIDTIVSITTDPLDALQQKVADEGLTIPVLSDPQLAVSRAYSANSYGMMGTSRDGHTFIVVGPDGRIRWRADYGGSPNYTMYVPVPNLIADIRAGLKGGSS